MIKVKTKEDISLLLDLTRMREASKKYGSDYEGAYEYASEQALKAIDQCDKLKRKIKMLEGVIAEQEKDFTRLDNIIHGKLADLEGDNDFVKGQIYALKDCLRELRGGE